MPIKPDAVLLNKFSSIQRCILRMQEEYKNIESQVDYSHIDAMILNIERACQGAIDIAMYLCSENKLGIPASSRDAFDILFKNNFISQTLCFHLKSMAAFRNIAVHSYDDLNLEIAYSIAKEKWQIFVEFANACGVSIKIYNQ